MRLSGSLIVVPEFIYEVINETGLAKETMLNIEELTKYFNIETLASFVAINEYISQGGFAMGVEQSLADLIAIKDTLMPYEFPESLVGNTTKVISDNALVILNTLNAKSTYRSHTLVVENLLGISSEDVKLKLPNYVYKLFYIKDNVFGLRLVPKPEDAENNPTITLESNMCLLNKHYKYEELVKTQLFRRWCNSTLRHF